METKLEITHLSPYLPYNLKAILTEPPVHFKLHGLYGKDELNKGIVWQLSGYANGSLNIPIGDEKLEGFIWSNGFTYANFNGGIKPILRPLSDLIKEIEHNQERFIPLHRLLQSYNIDIDDMSEEEIFNYADLFTQINLLNYNDSVLLCKWYFDIFNLIDSNLAINYNEFYGNNDMIK